MKLNEANYYEVESKLKDWLQKKQINPSYNRAYQAMSEDKLLTYIDVALNLGASQYESILRVLQQEVIDRLNHRAKKSPFNTRLLNDSVKIIDDQINTAKLADKVRNSAKNFEASSKYTQLIRTYQNKINKLISACSHLSINYSNDIMTLLDQCSVNNKYSCVYTFINQTHDRMTNLKIYKEAGLFDSTKSAPDLTNIDKFWLEFYTAVYKTIYSELVVTFKFLEMAASKNLLGNNNNINLFFHDRNTPNESLSIQTNFKSRSNNEFIFWASLPQRLSEDNLKAFLNGASNRLLLSYWRSGISRVKVYFDLNDLAGSFKELINKIALEL